MSNAKRRFLIVGIILFIVIGTVCAILLSGSNSRRYAVDRSKDLLLDSAGDEAATLSSVLYGQFQTLELFSSLVSPTDAINPESLNRRISEIPALSDMDKIAVIDSKGNSLNTDVSNVSDRAYFKKALSGVQAMEPVIGRATGDPAVMLAVPRYINGAIDGVVCGIYYEWNLRKLLNSDIYGGGRCSFIANSEGTVIISDDSEILSGRNNFLEAFRESGASDEEVSLLAEDMASGERGFVTFGDESMVAVAAYVPLNVDALPENDWFVFDILTHDEFENAVAVNRNVAIETMIVFAIFVLAALYLTTVLERDRRRRLAREAQACRRREEQFRIVAKQSGKLVYQYDILTDTAHRDEENPGIFDKSHEIASFIETAVELRFVADESIESFREFFKKIRAGESPVSGVFLLKNGKGEYIWYKHDSTTIFDSDGNPKSAIISYYDYSAQRELEIIYAKWQQEISGLSADNSAVYEWNMTKDALESTRGALVEDYASLENDSFNARTERYVAMHLFSEDAIEYRNIMTRENLIESYKNGKYSRTYTYRYISGDGCVYWRRLSVQLVQYHGSQDIKAYIINENIDKEKRAELDFIENAKIDALTGALNRAIFTKRVDELIASNPKGTHAFFMLDIDSFKMVNDTFGHDVGDQTLSELIGNARQALRLNDMIGRLGGDEFMVVIKDASDGPHIAEIARRLCDSMRVRLNDELSASASIGVAVYPRDGLTFDELYKNADSALYQAKQAGKGCFRFFDAAGDSAKSDGSEQVGETASCSGEAEALKVFFIGGTEAEFGKISENLPSRYSVEHIVSPKDFPPRLRETGSDTVIVIIDMALSPDDAKAVIGEVSVPGVESRAVRIALIPENDPDQAVIAVQANFDGYIFRPIGDEQLYPLMRAIIARSRNERMRYRQSVTAIKKQNDERYWRLLNVAGVSLVTLDIGNNKFEYSQQIKSTLAGNFDGRVLWRILLVDGVASASDVETLRSMVYNLAQSQMESASMVVRLMTKSGAWRYFRFIADRLKSGSRVTVTLAFVDIDDEVRLMKELETKARRDTLTGLYNREYFLEKVREMVSQKDPGYYEMSCFDINSFKTINDRYGTDKGDEILIAIGALLGKMFDGIGGIACRVSADIFAAIYPQKYKHSPQINYIHETAKSIGSPEIKMSYSIGRYTIVDPSMPVSAMYDRARIARSLVKGRYDVNIAQYDESMREKLLSEQSIISEMDAALKSGQFEMWLQPQFNHATKALIGAEALVRWRHPTKGMLFPGEFIPLFERTGFIYELDKYIWDKACRLIHEFVASGEKEIPISVNVSRRDVFKDDFFETITSLVERYGIPTELLRLEITESAFAEDTNQIITSVRRLREYGFLIEIDDFGSGYSSYNTLKDVPANIIKIDMRFLEDGSNSERGGNILESIVRMAIWLGMPVIAEGVESVEHADFLKSIGCFYIQGYLYAKPMPVREFEQLRLKASNEKNLVELKTHKGLNNYAFWDPKSMETLIFNSFVGGACICEYHAGSINLLRVNEKYAQILLGSDASIERAITIDWRSCLSKESLDEMKSVMTRAIESLDEENCVVHLSNLSGSRENLCLRIGVRVIARSGDRFLIYSTIDDLTNQWIAERRERESLIVREAIINNMGSGLIAIAIEKSKPRLLFANDRFYEQIGYTKEQYLAKNRSLLSFIYRDDLRSAISVMRDLKKDGSSRQFTCRATRADQSIIWLQNTLSVTTLPGVDKSVLLDVSTDITAQKNAEQAIIEKSEQLAFLNDTSRYLLSGVNPDEAMIGVLRKIIEYFDGNRAYIFEFSDDCTSAKNTYEVCAHGVAPEIDILQNIPLSSFGLWIEALDKYNHFEIENIDELDESRAYEKHMLQSQGIHSLATVAFRHNGKLNGFIGVDDPRRNFSHLSSLEALSEYMAVILSRRDILKNTDGDLRRQ